LSRPLAYFLVVTTFLAASCSSRVYYGPPKPPAAEPPVVLPVSFEDAWNAVIQTFFERNIPVKTLEKASGLLESDELSGEVGRTCDCGFWLGVPIAGYGAYGGDAYYRFRVLVERRGDGTASLTVRSSCRAHIEQIEGQLVCHLDPAKEAELRNTIVERARK
jgi:hypothetical protein